MTSTNKPIHVNSKPDTNDLGISFFIFFFFLFVAVIVAFSFIQSLSTSSVSATIEFHNKLSLLRTKCLLCWQTIGYLRLVFAQFIFLSFLIAWNDSIYFRNTGAWQLCELRLFQIGKLFFHIANIFHIDKYFKSFFHHFALQSVYRDFFFIRWFKQSYENENEQYQFEYGRMFWSLNCSCGNITYCDRSNEIIGAWIVLHLSHDDRWPSLTILLRLIRVFLAIQIGLVLFIGRNLQKIQPCQSTNYHIKIAVN